MTHWILSLCPVWFIKIIQALSEDIKGHEKPDKIYYISTQQ